MVHMCSLHGNHITHRQEVVRGDTNPTYSKKWFHISFCGCSFPWWLLHWSPLLWESPSQCSPVHNRLIGCFFWLSSLCVVAGVGVHPRGPHQEQVVRTLSRQSAWLSKPAWIHVSSIKCNKHSRIKLFSMASLIFVIKYIHVPTFCMDLSLTASSKSAIVWWKILTSPLTLVDPRLRRKDSTFGTKSSRSPCFSSCRYGQCL